MVNIALLGVSGGVGSKFVALALERGHRITSLARTPSKVKIEHANLTIVQGSSTVAEDVASIITPETDVIVSCLGNVDKNCIMKKSAQNIVAARPKRILTISSLGIGGSSRVIKFLLTMIIRKEGVKDYESAEIVYKDANNASSSSTSVVIVRPDVLCDKESNGFYRLTEKKGMGKGSLPRADVALCLVDLLENTKFDGKEVQLYARKKKE